MLVQSEAFLRFALSLFLIAIFVPLEVQHTLQHPPRLTYSLMALNIAIFLGTVAVANQHLPQDRIQGQRLLAAWRGGSGPAGEQAVLRQARATAGYTRLWQMEHADSDYVLEPHYSTLNSFAYRPAEPSWPRRLAGLVGSMFLHGSLLHLCGNMLFLWVFGQALEDKLGGARFLAIYFVSGLCGTLLYHLATVQFWPETAGLPALGASGAIAGLLGAFAARLRRVRIRVFCLPPLSWPVIGLVSGLCAGLIYLGASPVLARMAWLLTVGGLCWFGPGLMWAIYDMASMWAIGAWLLLFNVLPGLWSVYTGQGEGVAHWAHIGGFFAGLLGALAPTLVPRFAPHPRETAPPQKTPPQMAPPQMAPPPQMAAPLRPPQPTIALEPGEETSYLE